MKERHETRSLAGSREDRPRDTEFKTRSAVEPSLDALVLPASQDRKRLDTLYDGHSTAPAAPGKTGTLTEIADYLTTGYWNDIGNRGTRYFDMQANGGVLEYNLGNTPRISTAAGPQRDPDGVDRTLRPAIRDALDVYEEVLGITFLETVDLDGDVDIFFGDDENGSFAALEPDSGNGGPIDHAYINLPGSSSGPGDLYFTSVLHEIGHALGLGHAGPYNNSATFNNDAIFTNDSYQLTLMSYFAQDENGNVNASLAPPTTPMSVDWLALHDLYASQGYDPAANAFSGDTVYGRNTNISASESEAYSDLASLAGECPARC